VSVLAIVLVVALDLGVGATALEPPSGAAAPSGEAVAASAVTIPGRVVLDSGSSRLGMPAVTFDHWNHRVLYTCRVCHVDLGFAMRAGETAITAQTNEDGAHCGACHDGRRLHEGRPVFAACSGWPRPDPARGCTRCHTGRGAGRPAAYEQFRRTMPIDVGSDVDWVAASRQGRIGPADVLEGVTPNRATMRIDRNVEIRSVGTWMNDVTFSHKRHVGWIACELCHPDVFPLGRRGVVRYRMDEMRAGRSCGACHGSVAFPLSTCQRCHGRVLR
jgi:c(7)-type cytochrome triheme protein